MVPMIAFVEHPLEQHFPKSEQYPKIFAHVLQIAATWLVEELGSDAEAHLQALLKMVIEKEPMDEMFAPVLNAKIVPVVASETKAFVQSLVALVATAQHQKMLVKIQAEQN